MNSKNIKKHLKAKLRDWTEHIDNAEVKKVVEENTIITGGGNGLFADGGAST